MVERRSTFRNSKCRPANFNLETFLKVFRLSGAPNSAKFRGGCRFDKGGVTKFF